MITQAEGSFAPAPAGTGTAVSPGAQRTIAEWARAAALVLLVLVPLLPTLRATYVYDDTSIIRDNVALRGWGALLHVWDQPYWPSDTGVDALGLFRPLHIALLTTVWNLGGGSPRWFHVYALLLAIVTTLVVWQLLGRAVGVTAAFAAAAWFATHPLHVEAIASVANTSELLVLLWTVALARVLAAPRDAAASHVAEWRRAALIGALAAAALLSKESGLLAVPIAALTAWGWRTDTVRDPSLGQFLRANMRAWAATGVGVAGVVLLRSVALGAPVARASIAAQGLDALSTAARVRAMLSVWPRIAEMLVWPTALSPYYGPTIFPADGVARAVASALMVTALLGLAVAIAKRGDRRPLVAVAWVGLTYFPASNLAAATGQILSDRTLFGATVGVTIALAWGVNRLPRVLRTAALVVCAAAIGRDMFVTTRYAVAWTSHRTLWTRMLESAPDEHLGYKLLGIDARTHGDTSRALALLGRAFQMAPTDRQIRFEYGQVLYQTGRYAAAATTLAPLIREGDALSEREFVALYLDAVGRSQGPTAVVGAATPLLHSQSASVAALYLGIAHEQLGQATSADSAYSLGLRRSPRDTLLAARRAAVRARQ